MLAGILQKSTMPLNSIGVHQDRHYALGLLTAGDFDELKTLQLECFPWLKPWSREQFECQLGRFPEGQIGIRHKGRLVASASSLILSRVEKQHNYRAASGNGCIDNHNPTGDTLYGIEIMVAPPHRGFRLSTCLYDARKRLCQAKELNRIIVGGRIPGYTRFSGKLSAKEYAAEVYKERLIDPVLSMQLGNGFNLLGVVSDYLPPDKESHGYAAIMEWINA